MGTKVNETIREVLREKVTVSASSLKIVAVRPSTNEMGRKTARVDLVPAEGEKGMIAFETGQIRYAECGALRGEDAFYQLARHTEGFFRIHYGDKPPATNITHQTTYLLLEAMRRMDEEGLDLGRSDGT